MRFLSSADPLRRYFPTRIRNPMNFLVNCRDHWSGMNSLVTPGEFWRQFHGPTREMRAEERGWECQDHLNVHTSQFPRRKPQDCENSHATGSAIAKFFPLNSPERVLKRWRDTFDGISQHWYHLLDTNCESQRILSSCPTRLYDPDPEKFVTFLIVWFFQLLELVVKDDDGWWSIWLIMNKCPDCQQESLLWFSMPGRGELVMQLCYSVTNCWARSTTFLLSLYQFILWIKNQSFEKGWINRKS